MGKTASLARGKAVGRKEKASCSFPLVGVSQREGSREKASCSFPLANARVPSSVQRRESCLDSLAIFLAVFSLILALGLFYNLLSTDDTNT